jgi:hypothetical protein
MRKRLKANGLNYTIITAFLSIIDVGINFSGCFWSLTQARKLGSPITVLKT